ncbi:MAG: 2-succinyl-5-enolpyruvyl-6-hydroxy-3-cyclohexene-1-carboxylic-acid synthase [Caldilineaceae bacterium SB0661_bin_32]|uniref:2-succinyl-5-enolpyruvyl-6-hydroxy-3-cyclohexene-1-carboxylate synthase n=1 Tax=Caldilineaceae bacterium SB0661_bin_32 TaxID=2605255 RepID=A0A6B1D458_9CHLR|nr:2-succinyl-5-enolpyruvyl-6-hydroxy-3-cyclohexene-1-carboxylic-acid synthase [Caldilineaceae bacterium SB0661_bin_32]
MSSVASSPNPNLQFSETLVAGLADAGLKAVCIAPGSRSTPLALAFDAHPSIETFVHLDERCASFFALGMAQASGRPVALVCTSGTAALEFHAAVVEAKMAGVPLLVLTADRPPELRHSGANQTIDQVKMYGDHVLWTVDAALPEGDAPDVALRNMRTLAARCFAVANGIRKGPVHINFPFRKPLEPEAPYSPQFDKGQSSSIQRGVLVPTAEQIEEMVALVSAHEQGWIVCGPWAGRPPCGLVDAVAELGRSTGYPVFADPLSGLRFGPYTGTAPIIGSYESFLQHSADFDAPRVVIRFGAVPTSKYLNAYLERTAPAFQVHVRSDGVWADDSHRVHSYLQVDETVLCRQLAARFRRTPGQWAASILAAEERSRRRQERFLRESWSDAAAAATAVKSLPDDSNLFVGNSLPVRHVDQFAQPDTRRIHVYGNRGASGIDGVLSSALGVAAAERNRPMLLLIGDVSFYHDMNGLLAVNRHELDNVSVVLLNNGGGGVFRRLPIAGDRARFEELFLTPPGLDFSLAAAMYGLDFVRIQNENRAGLAKAICASRRDRRPTVIEVCTDGARDERMRRELIESWKDHQEEYT